MPRPRAPLALLLCSAVVAAAGCAVDVMDVDGAHTEVAVSGQALTAEPPRVRRSIHSYTAAQRATLVSAILSFITQPVLTEHANGHDWHHPTPNGELFFSRHHDYTLQLESYLLANGHSQFVPVPMWDPGTAIPSQFLVADTLVRQTALNANPNTPIPPAFAFTKLCAFRNAAALASNLEGWHDQVHGAIGGAMSVIPEAPGAPIFWLWHALIDDIYHAHRWRCKKFPAALAAPYSAFP